MDYILDPKETLELIQEIHRTDNFNSWRGTVKLPKRNYGPSGQKFRTLISELNNRLPSGYSYHEVGIFRGRTLLTSARDNPLVPHIGVDNFTQFDKEKENEIAIRDTIKEFEIDNVDLVCSDFIDYYENTVDLSKRNCGVFFYDAIHDYRNQIVGLMFGSKIVAPGGVLLIDDTNYGHVRHSTYDFLRSHKDYKLIFETFTGAHPATMSKDRAAEVRAGWWNGTQVVIYDPEHRIESLDSFREDLVEEAFARAVTQTSAECAELETRFV